MPCTIWHQVQMVPVTWRRSSLPWTAPADLCWTPQRVTTCFRTAPGPSSAPPQTQSLALASQSAGSRNCNGVTYRKLSLLPCSLFCLSWCFVAKSKTALQLTTGYHCIWTAMPAHRHPPPLQIHTCTHTGMHTHTHTHTHTHPPNTHIPPKHTHTHTCTQITCSHITCPHT